MKPKFVLYYVVVIANGERQYILHETYRRARAERLAAKAEAELEGVDRVIVEEGEPGRGWAKKGRTKPQIKKAWAQGKHYGWRMIFWEDGREFTKYFAGSKYGGIDGAYAAAVAAAEAKFKECGL